MSPIRSLLVHLDAGWHSMERLALARTLAAQHESRLRALLALEPRFVPLPLPMEAGGLPAAPLLDEVDTRHRMLAKARFDRAVSGAGWPVQWCELGDEPPIPGFASQALHADLVVLGQHDRDDADAFDVPSDFVPSVVVASGRPALVVPRHASEPFQGFGTVLVAWQACREAARALDAALPLLQGAREVHVVTWSDDDAGLVLQQQEVADHLALHGVHGVRCHRGQVPLDAGTALLTLCEGLGADLLVMGCYGHSRARELVLGGASRTVLRDARLPVLMAH
ncbi:MAG TPA: universal stress protein [Burkholderiaceae bacterium]|nr:universal stress protein [Burkholderiaceae bacterium]